MALRDQPYLPLYIQDIMTDEALNECSASTHGIYIKGIMCLMHKSKTYGKILLKQKYKQTKSISLNFALQISKHTPYSIEEIEIAINELLEERVCYIKDDCICQKRMIKDNSISEARSKAGKKGGGNPNFVKTNSQTKVKTNTQTNSEYEYEYENKDENINNNKKVSIEKKQEIPTLEEFVKYATDNDELVYVKYVELKYKSWVENNWKDGNDKKINNWKSKLLNTLKYLRNEENRSSNTGKQKIDPGAKENYVTDWDDV